MKHSGATPKPVSAEFVDFARLLADAAGAVIRPYFRAACDISLKSDHSPVTAADRAAEMVMRDLIAAHFPDHGVIGEEYGAERADARFVWTLDPIDGTRAFVVGRPLFGVLIALLDEGRPVLGVIDQPIIGDRWLGAFGHGTRFNDTPAQVRACPDLRQARLGTTSPQAFGPDSFAAFERLRPALCDVIYGGDCHNYGLVASGFLDLVVESDLKLHDFAALAPVVENAGGVMVDWAGQPLTRDSDGRVLAVGDPALIAPVLAVLNG